MAKKSGISSTALKKLQKQLNAMTQDQCMAFMEACAKELAARLLAKVIKKTPVGDYSKTVTKTYTAKKTNKYHQKGEEYTVTKRINPSGKMGGTLRRGWLAKSHEEAAGGSGTPSANAATSYVENLTINHIGDEYRIDIVNPVEYAPYVEFGHRTADRNGWVEGRFMLTISEQELQAIAPQVLERKIIKFLSGCIK